MLRLLLVTALLLVGAPAAAQSAAARAWLDLAPDVFVSAAAVASLQAEGAVLIDARSADAFEAGHAAGAGSLPWTGLVDGWLEGDVSDDDAALGQAVADAGVRADRPVLVYGAWSDDAAWGEEGRAWWTLRYLGHDDVRVVYGGVAALADAGIALTADAPVARPAPSAFVVSRRPALRATTEQVAAAASVIDTRSRAEYDGAVLYGEARGGHVPGATHLGWRALFDGDDLVTPEVARAQLSSSAGEPLVAYCTGGVRSAFVVMVAAALDIPARNYDASMWAWSADPRRPLTDRTSPSPDSAADE